MTRVVLCLIVLSLLCSGTFALCQDANPPIYSEIIPTSSGLAYNAVSDVRESFTAPNGKNVEVLVKGPVGSETYSRAIRSDETPDEYFPAVVAEAVKANAHHLVIPKGVYTFHGPKLCTDLGSPACNLPSSCNVNQYWNCQPHWTIGQYPSGQVTEPDSVSDLDIDFSGSELDFSAPVIGIWILEAQRLQLAGGNSQGPGATNLDITNNAMSDSGQWAEFYGAVSLVAPAADGSIVASPVFEKIKMQNNSIENVPGPAMIVTSTRDFSIDLNWISNANQVQASPTDYGNVSTLDSILLYQSSDGNVCDPYKSGPTTGPIGIDPSDSSIALESNCALYGNR